MRHCLNFTWSFCWSAHKLIVFGYKVTSFRPSHSIVDTVFTHSFMNFDHIEIQLWLFPCRKASHWHFLTSGGKMTSSFIWFIFYCLFSPCVYFAVDANCLTHQLFNKHFGATDEWMNEWIKWFMCFRCRCCRFFTFVTWCDFLSI